MLEKTRKQVLPQGFQKDPSPADTLTVHQWDFWPPELYNKCVLFSATTFGVIFSSSPKKQMYRVMVETCGLSQEQRQECRGTSAGAALGINSILPGGSSGDISPEGRATTFHSYKVLLPMEAQLKARACWGLGGHPQVEDVECELRVLWRTRAAVFSLLRNPRGSALPEGVAAAMGSEFPYPA